MSESKRPAAGGTADRPDIVLGHHRDDIGSDLLPQLKRERLPNRRAAETLTVIWRDRPIAVTVGFAPDGRVLEVFASAGRPDSDLDCIVDDFAVTLSRALQYGDDLASVARGIGRLPLGEPSSVAGAIIDAALRLCGS